MIWKVFFLFFFVLFFIVSIFFATRPLKEYDAFEASGSRVHCYENNSATGGAICFAILSATTLLCLTKVLSKKDKGMVDDDAEALRH